MSKQTLKFVDIAKQMPEKRPPEQRRKDFNEIYAVFDPEEGQRQAGRCSQCGVPFCQVHCPLHNNIPDWLQLTAEGRMEEAYEMAASTNNMPEVCGRICPQDRLCEGNCVIEQAGHGTVTIGAVETYITETAWDNDWVQPAKPPRERGESVGIVGAGPAGMAAAEQLRRKGYQVHVYDRYDRVGGLMIYGIPNFKLEKYVIERRARLLNDSGVHFHLRFEVGRDATLEQLRGWHDAVLLATGVYKARDVNVPGAGLGDVRKALDFLVTENKRELGDPVPEYDNGALNAKGKDVVVIGGGDTAMDCVRTSVRQGANSVRCLYRRDRKNMPGSQREVANAEDEGVEFVWLSAPQAVLGEQSARAVRTAEVRLGVPDASGRQTPQVVQGTEKDIPADLVIKALGFDPEDLPTLFDAPELKTTRRGTVHIDFRSMMTNLNGVFAAGDIARGASLVVWAIRDGRDAAAEIDQYLKQRAGQGHGVTAMAAE